MMMIYATDNASDDFKGKSLVLYDVYIAQNLFVLV